MKKLKPSETIRAGMPKEVSFTVPMVPPGVNHYVRHTKQGIHYIAKESKDFKMLVLCAAQRQSIRADAYELETTVYLGKGHRGDLDNFCKLIADSLVKASVIDSDAKITRWTMGKDRDWSNPRTEITVRGVEK